MKKRLDKRVKNIPYKYERQWPFEERLKGEKWTNCGLSATTTTILVTRSLPLISLKLQVDWKVTTKVNPKSVSAAGNERDKFFPETWVEILTGFDSRWSLEFFKFFKIPPPLFEREKRINGRKKRWSRWSHLRCNLK